MLPYVRLGPMGSIYLLGCTDDVALRLIYPEPTDITYPGFID
jgi:hypothetical protein